MEQALQDKLDRLPTEPGVYLMKDHAGRVIYVGKAVNLRARVRSYFNRGGDSRAFVALLDRVLGDLEVMVVHNEKEALLLESALIKTHKPRFNVLLKDDKSFICLRLDEKAKWPRLEVVRAHNLQRDGARYFGPYSSATSIRETLRTINRHFQLRTCNDQMLELCHKRNRPCILFQIGRCPGPCIDAITPDDYRRNVRDTVLFLEGKEVALADRIKQRMLEASDRLDFESAARLRDQVRAIERSLEKQRTVSTEPIDRDVFGLYREGDRLMLYVVYVRTGRILGGRAFPFSGQEFPDEELLSSFVDVYYGSDQFLPDEVLLPFDLEDLEAKEAWLSDMRGRRVHVKSPRRGALAELVSLAQRNAETAFHENRRTRDETEAMLVRLQNALGLKRVPRRIECYDISLFQGASAVGSQVTFTEGEPDKARYRKFKIKTVTGTDDFAMLYEVLTRRAKKGLATGDLPDLFVIDSGKGQLGSAAAEKPFHVKHL
ncbi:MAG: excinuclease ABC subunit UvrC, partial [Myxococcales bacterium]